MARLAPALAALAAGCAGPADPGCGERALVRIESGQADEIGLSLAACAELAVTEDERRRGLRGHAPLAPGEALLIALPRALDGVCVVNDGVGFDIDAIFAGADGTVVAVERAIPAGDGAARCHDQTRWIVELAAGQAALVSPEDRLLVELLPVLGP